MDRPSDLLTPALPPDLLLPALPDDLTPITVAVDQAPAREAVPPRFTPDEVEDLCETVEASDADATKRAYRSAWTSFTAWCGLRGATALPAHPQTLAGYLRFATKEDGNLYAVGSLNLHLSAIKRAHREHGLAAPTEHPLVYRTWKGVRRQRGAHQEGAAPLTIDLLRQVVDALPSGPLGARDRALLLVGFGGAFRRSELAALTLSDVGLTQAGLRLRVERRKTGDEPVWLDFRRTDGPYCPTTAVEDYLDALIVSGTPLALGNGRGSALWRGVRPHGSFAGGPLSAAMVRTVVMRSVDRAGLGSEPFSAHSLRSGYATSAAEGGASAMEIREAGGWKSVVTVDRYVRHRRQMGTDAPRSRVLADLSEGK